jgi:phosphomannomutase
MDNSKRVFLFDLDGTLTEARKPAASSLGPALRDLVKLGRIVIVTGSDYDFINEQLNSVWSYVPCANVTLMPCNGTKKYVWKKEGFNSRFVLDSELSMKECLGGSAYKKLINYILKRQLNFVEKSGISEKCSGRFVSYRGSMINWSPLGRDGVSGDRDFFEEYDAKNNYRKKEIKRMKKFVSDRGIPVKISYGGDTSFDIFPLGWDKTLALKDVSEKEVYFFGDRCNPGGNDYEIYREVSKTGGFAYHVDSPEETLEILLKIIQENK